jgi:hypothetical protein
MYEILQVIMVQLTRRHPLAVEYDVSSKKNGKRFARTVDVGLVLSLEYLAVRWRKTGSP